MAYSVEVIKDGGEVRSGLCLVSPLCYEVPQNFTVCAI